MSEKIDVILINPADQKKTYQGLSDEFSGIEPPIFAGMFAAYLRLHGWRVAIYDVPALGQSAQEAASAILENYAPLMAVLVVYGLQPSASTQNMTPAGKIASYLKEESENLPIMMLGTHPAALPEQTMREEAIDFVCDGEGPITMHQTIAALTAKDSRFADIPNLWWRDSGQIIPPRSAAPLIQNLDKELPGIAWDLLPMDKYRAHNWHCFDHIHDRSPYAAIHTSFGCPFKCSFCCINAPFGKPSYRMRAPEFVVSEIDTLVHTYGVKNIKISDEMFILNRRHVLGICNLLRQRHYKVNIWAYARVDTVEKEMLPIMKDAGINWLCLGIESASSEVRDGARKKFGTDDIVKVVRDIQNAGIRVLGNFIFGLPDDTLASMRETTEFALELKCEFANFYSAMPYPGSELYTTSIKNNLELPGAWEEYSQHAYGTRPLPNDHVTAADILRARDGAFMKYFQHKPYIEMVGEMFGQDVVNHIDRMLAVPFKRKILEKNT